MTRLLAAVLLAAFAAVLSAQGRARDKKPQAEAKLPALGQAATETVAHSFETAEGWSMRAIALLSLGTDWHPAGSGIVLAALRDEDARLRPFGIEQLRRTDARVFASVCSAEIVRELVEHQLQAKHELVRQRALELLQRLFPDAGADAAAMRRYWRDREKDYAPPPWTPAAVDPNAPGTVSSKLVERAFDLRDAGLEVAIVIDSTGSMQIAIDAARDAIGDVVSVLSSIAPKLKLGLVHYKDLGDFGEGARLLAPLTRNQSEVRDRLAKLTAGGGGDMPEKVDAGIELALGKEMHWNKDANRLILVVGDAPPHEQDMAALLQVVELAHKAPFTDPKRPTTGQKQALRPFVVSTIATSPGATPAFEQIAKAGGGTCVLLSLGGGRPGGFGRAAAAPGPDAAELLARHVLMLSFGAQFEVQLRVFVDTFFAYRKAGAL